MFSQPWLQGPAFLGFLLVAGKLGPFAKRSDIEMAPEKKEKKAAESANATTRSADMEAQLNRIRELKVKFAGVGKLSIPS